MGYRLRIGNVPLSHLGRIPVFVCPRTDVITFTHVSGSQNEESEIGFVPQVIRCRVTGHSGLCGFCRKVGGRSGGGRRGGPDGTVVGRPGGEMAGGQLQPFGFGRSGNLTFWTPYSRPGRGSSMAAWPCRWPDAWPRWLGKEFETLFQELLAGPLRMTRSHFLLSIADGGHAPMLGGGLCTTLNDYMNFLDMIIHGGVFEGQRILREATVKEMQADQVGRAKVAGGEYVSVRSDGIIRAFTDWANGVKWWTRRPERPIVSVRRDGPELTLGLTLREGVYGFFIAHVTGSSSKPTVFPLLR